MQSALCKSKTAKVTTNTVESANGFIRRWGRKLNLFTGSPGFNKHMIECKLQEIVKRFNCRRNGNNFFEIFLKLLRVYFPGNENGCLEFVLDLQNL
jgi:hypothetical protein